LLGITRRKERNRTAVRKTKKEGPVSRAGRTVIDQFPIKRICFISGAQSRDKRPAWSGCRGRAIGDHARTLEGKKGTTPWSECGQRSENADPRLLLNESVTARGGGRNASEGRRARPTYSLNLIAKGKRNRRTAGRGVDDEEGIVFLNQKRFSGPEGTSNSLGARLSWVRGSEERSAYGEAGGI